MEGEDRRRLPSRREKDADVTTAVELTEQFIEDVNARLDQLQKMLWGRWIFVVVSLLVAGGAFAYSFGHTQSNIRDFKKNRIALCALRADLDKRIASGQKFLASHPNSIPGIPVSLVNKTLSDEKHSRQALSVVSCP